MARTWTENSSVAQEHKDDQKLRVEQEHRVKLSTHQPLRPKHKVTLEHFGVV